MRSVEVVDLGLVPYDEAEALQATTAAARRSAAAPDTLFLLEHPPVITLGRRGSPEDVYAPPDRLAQLGIEVRRTTRGGLVTYHGPGQVVGYPILRLAELGLRVPGYVRALEETVIRALAAVGVAGRVDPDHPGVWTDGGKIAAIGVRFAHGVTTHGFAVNLQPDLAHFQWINPCGLEQRGVSSVAALTGREVPVAWFKEELAQSFAATFGVRITCTQRAALPRA